VSYASFSGQNDGRFPDGTAVLTRYPGPGMTAATPREEWPWLPAEIESQGDTDEWLVTIYARELAQLEDGANAPAGTPGEDLYWPQAFRDSTEIRPAAG
jgi:hypothetical protein